MKKSTLKVAIPMAGLGTVLDYVLCQFETVPDSVDIEYIFIIGPTGEQVKDYMQEHHPDKKVKYVLQAEMRGQSDAIYQAREHLTGPMVMTFADTLIETDLSFLPDGEADGYAWVKPVPDPRRFGVAELDDSGWVKRLIEKPQDVSNNLAVVGFYYFKSAERLLAAIEEQMRRQITLKNEYFLTDAINILLEGGAHMRTKKVDVWLDAGTPDAVLETNRHLLEHGHDNTQEACKRQGVTVIPPVFIHETAHIESSVVGPFVSIGPECELKQAIVINSIVEEGTHVEEMILEDSLIGRHVHLRGQPVRLNLGDESWARS